MLHLFLDAALKTVAYLRVSTRSQDLANQKLAILEFSQKRRFPIDQFIESRISSRQSPLERRIDEMLGTLEPGDRLLVSELSRLGRSLSQVIQIVETLVRRKIRFIAIKEAIEFDGKQDLPTKVMIALFGLFAEVERDLISERTKEGLAAAKAKGKLLGRPKGALGTSRLDGHRFRANEVPLQLSVPAYNLGNLWRRLELPNKIKSWSLTSLQHRLMKTGGRLVKHARYYWLLPAEGHLNRRLFGDMLHRIWALLGCTFRVKEKTLLEPPKSSPRKAGMRVVVEALAQATPITAGLAHLYRFTHPSEMERAVASWRDQVSDTSNVHEAMLRRLEEKIAPRLRVSEIALALTLWLVETSESGLSTPLSFEEVLLAFPETDKGSLEEACHELQHLDFASLSAALGHPVRSIRPTYKLFWEFDPI